jgi:hypothetical protein
MRGLDPRIHLKEESLKKTMDRRVKPGNDNRKRPRAKRSWLPSPRRREYWL